MPTAALRPATTAPQSLLAPLAAALAWLTTPTPIQLPPHLARDTGLTHYTPK